MPGYTDAQRRARNKYQKSAYVVCAAKLKKADAERFRAALEQEGQTVNSYLTACAMAYLEQHPAPGLQDTSEE